MGFIGLLAILAILVVQPMGLRDLLRSLGADVDRATGRTIPWYIMRAKSMVVGRLVFPSLLMVGLEALLLLVLYSQDAELIRDWFMVGLATGMALLLVFAVWNWANGKLIKTGPGDDDWGMPYAVYPPACLPHVWAILTPSLWAVQGTYLVVLALAKEDYTLTQQRIILALGFGCLAAAWTMGKLTIEVLAWLVLKGTSLGEWFITMAMKLPGIPEEIKDSIPTGGVDVLPQEKISAAMKKYWNLAGIAWLPFGAITFWFPDTIVAIVFAFTTVLASVFSLALTSLGEGEKVDKSTKATVEWFWKWGKVITPAICGLITLFQFSETVRMSLDDWGNTMAGISPIHDFTLKPRYFVVVALGIGIVIWIIKKLLDVASGIWEKAGKVAIAALGLGAIYCVVGFIATICHHPTFSLDRRYPATAENPIGLSTPTAQFRAMDNGQQELVLTVFSRAKQAKGVVEFDQATATRLGVPQQMPVRMFSDLRSCAPEDGACRRVCGDKPCRQHQVTVPGLTGTEAGTYAFVMRNTPYGQVEETSRHSFGPGSRVSQTP